MFDSTNSSQLANSQDASQITPYILPLDTEGLQQASNSDPVGSSAPQLIEDSSLNGTVDDVLTTQFDIEKFAAEETDPSRQSNPAGASKPQSNVGDELLNGGTSRDSNFGPGSFTVGSSGQVEIDYLFDGGGYEGELAVFKLDGMAELSQTEFAQEAIRRSLTAGSEGQIVISDKTEGARYSVELGEPNRNKGEAAETKLINWAPGTQFGLMLMPNSDIALASEGRSVTPLFSTASANKNGQEQFAKASKTVFAIEDISDPTSDRDFNDMLVSVRGAQSELPELSSLIAPEKNWLSNPKAQPILNDGSENSVAPTAPPSDLPLDKPLDPTKPADQNNSAEDSDGLGQPKPEAPEQGGDPNAEDPVAKNPTANDPVDPTEEKINKPPVEETPEQTEEQTKEPQSKAPKPVPEPEEDPGPNSTDKSVNKETDQQSDPQSNSDQSDIPKDSSPKPNADAANKDSNRPDKKDTGDSATPPTDDELGSKQSDTPLTPTKPESKKDTEDNGQKLTPEANDKSEGNPKGEKSDKEVDSARKQPENKPENTSENNSKNSSGSNTDKLNPDAQGEPEQTPETEPEDNSPSEPQQTEEAMPPEPPAPPAPQPNIAAGFSSAISQNVAKFNPGSSESEIAASGAQKVQIGSQTIYIGTQQVSSINQNPIIRSFDPNNPANNWTRTDYEATGADGRGLGLIWSGSALYGIFSVDGTQGSPSQDFRRASDDAEQGWLRSYGPGGGAKAAVIGRINPATGQLETAAYLSSVLKSGKTNTLSVIGARTNSAGNLVLSTESYFSPRQPNGQPLVQTGDIGDSPFDYTIEITPDLKKVLSTAAPGWSNPS